MAHTYDSDLCELFRAASLKALIFSSVEYSFCKMRLPATGLTLPWQLVAAQEPGPMYFAGSPFESAGLAASAAGVSAGLAAEPVEVVGWAGPFFAAVIRTAKASGRRSAAHSAARSQ